MYHQPLRSVETKSWVRNGDVETREIWRSYRDDEGRIQIDVTVETRAYAEPISEPIAPVTVATPIANTVEMEISTKGAFKAEYKKWGRPERVSFFLSDEDMEAYDMYTIMSALKKGDKVSLVGEGRDWLLAPGEAKRILG